MYWKNSPQDFMYYCPKCGDMSFIADLETTHKCSVCNAILKKSPAKYGLQYKTFCNETTEQFEAREQKFLEEVIKNNPEFDTDLHAKKDQIKKIQHEKEAVDSSNRLKQGYSSHLSSTAKCPFCQSANIRKISGLERTASISILGLFSNKIGKTWACENCKSL